MWWRGWDRAKPWQEDIVTEPQGKNLYRGMMQFDEIACYIIFPNKAARGLFHSIAQTHYPIDSCRGTPLQVQTGHQRILLNTPTLGHP